ncbi:MAG: hypothetical protein LC641_00550 [Spirochaeta sp.]|nr:hypothetical protein [Spirochaeta sp.]
MNFRRTVTLAQLILVFAVLAVPLSGQSLADWYAESPLATRYTAIRGELEELHAHTVEAGVDPEFLLIFLREGAAKGVAPERLLPAADQYVQHTLVAARVLEVAPWNPDDLLPAAVSFLQIGYGESDLLRLVSAASSSRRAREGLYTLAAIHRGESPESDLLMELGEALLASEIPVASFSAIASVYDQGRDAGLSSGRILELFIRTIEQGGGLIQLRRAVSGA